MRGNAYMHGAHIPMEHRFQFTPMCNMPPRVVLDCCGMDIITLAEKHIHTCMHISADGNGTDDITMFERCSCVLGCTYVVGEGGEVKTGIATGQSPTPDHPTHSTRRGMRR